MLLLIGSQALKYHKRLLNREPYDYDFISTDPIERVNKEGIIAEFYYGELSDNLILNKSKELSLDSISTPFGEALVASLELLKVLKLSCVDELDKAKHTWDLEVLEDISIEGFEYILNVRKDEVKKRVAYQKKNFFNKYKGVTHYVDHDWMHSLINPSPIYLKTLKNAVDACEDRFNRLTEQERLDLVREECLVLALERDLIPRIKKAPFLVKVLVRDFMQTNTSNTSAMRWLSRLSIESKVKDHPPWVTKWTAANNNFIMQGLDSWWKEKLNNMPVEFWKKVLE